MTILVLVALFLTYVTADSADKRATCLERGFDSDSLDCKLCTRFTDQFLADLSDDSDLVSSRKAFVSECEDCCTDIEALRNAGIDQKFAKAVLEVSPRRLRRYPKLEAFINERASSFARLEVQHVLNKNPHLIFYDEQEEEQDDINIANWDEDTVTEYLTAKLYPEDTDATGSSEEEVDNKEEL